MLRAEILPGGGCLRREYFGQDESRFAKRGSDGFGGGFQL